MLTALLLAATALIAIPAIAQPGPDQDQDLETAGYVDGSGQEAEILCKWELPDADSYTFGMQYGEDLGWYDAGYPCWLDNGWPTYEGENTVIAVEAPAHDLYEDGYGVSEDRALVGGVAREGPRQHQRRVLGHPSL